MINGSMGDFVYTTEVTLKAFNVDNAHVTINFNHNSSYRFVLWDNQNTKKFWFGGIFSGAGTINGGAGAQSYLDASALPVTFNLAVLSRNKVQYLFIEGELVALYNNGYTPRCLTIGAEKCDIAFNNNTVAHSSTTLFSTYASKVTSVSLTSKFMTFANKSIVSNSTPVADINTELTHTAGNSTTIVGTSSKFLFTANLTIKAITAGGNCHVSLSVGNNHSTSHRFLIWDLNGDGTFYFGYGPTYANTSKGYFTYSANSTLEIAVLSTAKNAYLFVNGALQTVFAGKGNCTLLYATEKMQTSLTNGAVHPEGSQQYNKYANQSFMTTYETGSYTTGQEIDVGGEHYISDNIANFVHNSTTAGAAVNSATTIPGTTGAFVYESTITINSYATNGHISINFISSTTTSSNRFLIWDNSSTGKFLFGGASNDTHGTGSGSISATSPVTFTLAVYVNNNKAYMFINGELKTVLVLGFSVDKLTIGAEGCNVSFNSNKVSNSYINASNFTSYASKSGVSNYASSAVGLYDHTNGGNKIA